MNCRAMLWLAALCAVGSMPAMALDLRQRSESGNKQFVVYSEDVRLRQRVASFAEEVKNDVMRLVGEGDLWKAPIVITLERATTMELKEPPARLRLAETQQPSFKIEISVKIGDDPAAVHLQKLLVRAVLLEYAYRYTGVSAGQPVVEPPWWIVEGMLETARRREEGTDTALFQRLVEANRLPPIEKFLTEKPDELGPSALAVDRALAMSLLQLLVEQPDGRKKIGKLLRDWPQSDGDPATLLARHFSDLGTGPVLQKWWTLNLARFAAVDRYQGLTAEETEKELGPLLGIELVINKKGEKKTFAIAEYPEFLKLPGSREVLEGRFHEVVALGTRASILCRPAVVDYAEILSLLSKGKTRGVKERLAKTEEYRQRALKRSSDIADYMNWFEATQMKTRSGAFDNYLKTAADIAEQERKQKGLVGRYLDEIEKEL
jgi:hypothetical protein